MDALGKTRSLLRRTAAWLRRGRLDAQLAEEIRQHIELRTRALVDDGMDPREAAYEARRMFGNPTLIREETRDMWGYRWIDAVCHDVWFAGRLMRRTPQLTAIAVLSLAVGVGASTVVTGIVNAALWRWSAMYHDPSRLVFLWQTREGDILTPTPADFRDWREMATSFDGVEAYTYRSLTYAPDGHPEQLRAALVTPGLFATLGVEPIAGAGFRGDEEAWGRHKRVLLGEALWRQQFGSDPSLIGRVMNLDGEPYEVAGIMPAGTWFTASKPDVFVPLAFAPGDPTNNRNSHFIWVLARLRPDVTFDDAAAEMAVLARQLEARHPANRGLGAAPRRAADHVLEDPARTLAVLAAAVVLVLLIASANVASLLLVRTSERHREIAVRAALGAGRARIARQLLTEGLVLAILGGGAGCVVAWAASSAVPGLLPADLPRIAETGLPIDWRVLSITAGTIVACALVIGVLPAFTLRWRDVADPLRETSRSASDSPRQRRLTWLLVCGEIAVALVLVACAALLVRSFHNLQRTDLGVSTGNLLTVRLPLPRERGHAANAASTSEYLETIAQAARTIPGVLNAGITSHVPLGGDSQSKHFFVVGQRLPATYEDVPSISLRQEGPQSLPAMGARLLKGRFFTTADQAGATPVAIVNATLAKRFFGAGDPIGRVICLNAPEHLSPPDHVERAGGSFVRWTIVGVVEDILYSYPADPMEAVVHVPHRQRTQRTLMSWAPDFLVLQTTTGVDVMPALRERLREAAPSQPIAEVRSIDVLAAEAFSASRVMAFVLSVFSGVALFLAAVGVYGAVAAVAARRTREIGIRMALGADSRRVVWLLIREAAAVCAAGVPLGLVGTLAAGAALQSQLYGIATTDARTYAVAAMVVCGVTALAAWIPGRRAAHIDPVTALRNE